MEINRPIHFSIPKHIVEYVIENNLEKCFSVYLYLKLAFSGIFHESELCFQSLGKFLGIVDKRTIKKYIGQLLDCGFLGYNKYSKNYFVRGFLFIHKMLKGSGKMCFIVPYERIRDMKNYLSSGLIGFKVKGLERAENRIIKKKVGSSAQYKRGALQRLTKELGFRGYFGLSNTQIATLLNCTKSVANRIKLASKKNGYLLVNKKYKVIMTLLKPDLNVRAYLPKSNTLSFRTTKTGMIQIREQLTDEIIPMVYWTKKNIYK